MIVAVQKSCINASAAVAVFVEWWIVYCVCGMIDSCVYGHCVYVFITFSFMTAPRHQYLGVFIAYKST